jgi:hypothetical protein
MLRLGGEAARGWTRASAPGHHHRRAVRGDGRGRLRLSSDRAQGAAWVALRPGMGGAGGAGGGGVRSVSAAGPQLGALAGARLDGLPCGPERVPCAAGAGHSQRAFRGAGLFSPAACRGPVFPGRGIRGAGTVNPGAVSQFYCILSRMGDATDSGSLCGFELPGTGAATGQAAGAARVAVGGGRGDAACEIGFDFALFFVAWR